MVFQFNTKLVGQTFRKESIPIIQTLQEGESLVIEHEPTNKFDANALKVMYNGTQLGYISRETASKIVGDVKDGTVTAKVSQVTGGVEGKENVGLNMEITVNRPEKEILQ